MVDFDKNMLLLMLSIKTFEDIINGMNNIINNINKSINSIINELH